MSLSFMTEEDILRQSTTAHRLIFEVVKQGYLLPDEQIVFGAHCTVHEFHEEDRRGFLSMMTGGIAQYEDVVFNGESFLIVTNKRWIRKPGFVMDRSSGTRIRKDGIKEWRWVSPQATLPERWLRVNNKTPEQYAVHRLRLVPLSEIGVVMNREEYLINHNKMQLRILLLQTEQRRWLSLDYENGKLLDYLLQLASTNNGVIPINSADRIREQ